MFLVFLLLVINAHSLVTNTASNVYGQTSFTSNGPGLTASNFDGPTSIAIDSTGVMYVSEYRSARVSIYPSTSATEATSVIGAPNLFTISVAGCSSILTSNPSALAIDSGDNLYVADLFCNRVVMFPKGTTTATFVYGESSFTNQHQEGMSTNQKFLPNSIAIDQRNNDLYVCDGQSNRVMVFTKGSITAKFLYGQPNYNTAIALNPPTSSSLTDPKGVTIDQNNGNVYIADTGNNRVLMFLQGQTISSMVYGQPSFTTNAIYATSASSLTLPIAVAIENNNLFVADSSFRVVAFPPNSNVATGLYGQTSFSNGAKLAVSATSCSPNFISFSSNNMFIVETQNNRVTSYRPALITQYFSQMAICTGNYTSLSVSYPSTCTPSVCTLTGNFASMNQCFQFVPHATTTYIIGWSTSTSCSSGSILIAGAPENTCSGFWSSVAFSGNCDTQTLVTCSASQASCGGCTSSHISTLNSCVVGSPAPSIQSYEWICPSSSSTTTENGITTSTNGTRAPTSSSMVAISILILFTFMFMFI